MKTQMKLTSILLVGAAILFTNCTGSTGKVPGSLNLKAASLKFGAAPAATISNISLTSAIVQIQNLVIEENSGNNSQSNLENNMDSNLPDGTAEGVKMAEKDGGNITMAGPYVLNVLSGNALIDNVSLQPGNYKQVDFSFVPNKTNAHSIVITGNFNNNGILIPFTITSDITNSVQLPLSGTGLTITTGTTSSLSIVFDVNAWIKNLDFSTAIITNNSINISNTENQTLYNVFISALATNIDTEK
jgi:hypothetical protein